MDVAFVVIAASALLALLGWVLELATAKPVPEREATAVRAAPAPAPAPARARGDNRSLPDTPLALSR